MAKEGFQYRPQTRRPLVSFFFIKPDGLGLARAFKGWNLERSVDQVLVLGRIVRVKGGLIVRQILLEIWAFGHKFVQHQGQCFPKGHLDPQTDISDDKMDESPPEKDGPKDGISVEADLVKYQGQLQQQQQHVPHEVDLREGKMGGARKGLEEPAEFPDAMGAGEEVEDASHDDEKQLSSGMNFKNIPKATSVELRRRRGLTDFWQHESQDDQRYHG